MNAAAHTLTLPTTRTGFDATCSCGRFSASVTTREKARSEHAEHFERAVSNRQCGCTLNSGPCTCVCDYCYPTHEEAPLAR